ncbi:hypothetical protein HanIR_Chr11g0548561 [Helianthus annuus]|nr:hypothetical protein HanIR_Chr11g0548561 [Helianthus annuus]
MGKRWLWSRGRLVEMRNPLMRIRSGFSIHCGDFLVGFLLRIYF